MKNLLTKIVLSLTLFGLPAVSQAALNSTAGTDYANTTANSWVSSGPAGDALEMVNFLLCVIEKSNTSAHVNETYTALVDENKCNGVPANSPAYAAHTITTSIVDNDSPYTFKSWFVTADKMNVVADGEITQSATPALPRGVMRMAWAVTSPTNRIGNKGELKTLADGTISYIENGTEDGGTNNSLMYIHGNLAADGSSGNLRVQSKDYSNGSAVTKIYRYVFDESEAHYQHTEVDGDAAVCLDRTASVKRTYQYKLFNADGSEKIVSGPFDFYYPEAGTYRGWSDPNGAWLQGDEEGSAKPAYIWRKSDDQKFSICYDDNWDDWDNYDNGIDDTSGNACGTKDDGVSIHLVNQTTNEPYAFDPAVKFKSVTFADSSSSSEANVTVSSLEYKGEGSNFGLGMECKGIDNDGNQYDWRDERDSSDEWQCDGPLAEYRPKYGMPDQTELTELSTDTKFYSKAIDSQESLTALVGANDCSSLNLATAPVDAGYTLSSIAEVSTLWADKPADDLLVIHGVEQ